MPSIDGDGHLRADDDERANRPEQRIQRGLIEQRHETLEPGNAS